MSGIAIVGGCPDALARARAMVGAMAPFGQISETVGAGRGVALGKSRHGRLAGDRPPACGADGLAVAVDGEIFDDRGPVPDPGAVIADHYRADTLDRLADENGSFAAIIVDSARRRVVLAGDRLGSRSLFVWHDGDRFAAASRLHALLGDDRVPRRLNVQGLVELVSFARTVADHTQYAGVRALTGATVYVIERGRLEVRRTRRLAWSRPEFDERECAVRLDQAMRAALARRVADAARPGLLLSGGLDSRWVLAAARATERPLACITAAIHENREVALARALARCAGMTHRTYANPPPALSATLDAAVRASDGLFRAPLNLFGLLQSFAADHDLLLSGHGLDYTLRGYYLPCVTLRIAGSVTRLPRLRPVPDGSVATVAGNMRVGVAAQRVAAILSPAVRRDCAARQEAAVAAALAGADIEDPYDAWDAFILDSLNRHYAYSDFVAMTAAIDHRPLAFDKAVFDTYLAMPPEWRASGRAAHAAMMAAGADLMALPDANTGFAARHGFRAQIALQLGRATLRRLGVVRRPTVADPTLTHGSWPNYNVLLRRDPEFHRRLDGLARSPALLDTGVFEPRAIVQLWQDHRTGRGDFAKLLVQLLSLESWLREHHYEQVSDAA
ncbi:MAG: asparagine synthase-related protein [Alphaproteobacteria bacterium]|jgi:asparagine synthetase B (glutamine-hydrolysing)|nr:asparagine synthase-related protein [Alphaproteobacteria bacterium]